jgi:anaerobic selenocysteine-containing dehydrogenase
LLADGADHEYLEGHADGLERLAAAVEPYDLVRSAGVTGLDPQELEDLLAAVRRHRRVAVQTGTGISMTATANVIEWLVWSLQIVTNSFEEPGGSWFHPGYLRALEERAIEASDGTAEPGPASRPELPRRLNEYPVAGMLDEIESGNLRALFVIGGNPLLAFPDADRTRKAMEQLEVLVLCDIVENQMTPLATHVFACADQLERSDLPVFLDQFLPAVMTRYAPAVMAPQKERKPLWWPFAHLGRRWGLDAVGGGADPDLVTDDDLLRVVGDRSRSDFDTIVRERVLIHEPSQLRGWVHSQVLPGGRWRIAPEPLVEQLATVTDHADGLRLVPRRQARHLNSVFVPNGKSDEAALLVNPVDAERAGVASGDRVVIRSAHGSTEAVATVSDRIRPGAVSLPHGFEDANVSLLTSADDGVDPLSGMVLQSGIDVSLEVIERGTE